MKSNLTLKTIRLVWLLSALSLVSRAWACGTGSSATITNLSNLPGANFQVWALNQTGQVTGYFSDSTHAAHAFLFDSGTITDLGTFGGSTSIGYAINNLGQIAGESYYGGDAVIHAFFYANGNVQDLGTLGGSYSSASALNDSGQVVGGSTTATSSSTHAFLYANGAMSDLGTLGGNYSSAFAINSSGMVAGESYLANGDDHGFVYSSGTMSDVGTLGGNYSSAFAVNDSGLVVGESYIANGDTHAFAWQSGVLTDLGTLGGRYSSAWGVNRAGQVLGIANTTGDAETHGFIYANGVMTDLGTLGGNYSTAVALNNQGQVVGDSAIADGTSHAFLWQKGQMVDLNTLIPASSGWVLTSGQYINDAGRIVGFGTYQGTVQWFVVDLGGTNSAPTAIAGPDQTVECDSQVTLDGSKSSDSDGDTLTFEWSLSGSVLGTTPLITVSLPLGTNVVTLKVTSPCGVSAETNVTVTVRDTTPPTGSCPGAITASADGNCQAAVPNVLPQVTASDNCTPADSLKLSQSPAAGTLVGLGPNPITVTVTDASGNTSTCTVLFNVVDTTPPVILSVPGLITVSADGNCQGAVPNVLPKVVATDNCSPVNQLVLSQIPAAGTLVGSGQYTITVKVNDPAGNSSSASVPFQVVDTTPPAFVSVPGPILVSADSNCQGAVPNVLPSVLAQDNCTPANQILLAQSPAAGTMLPKGQSVITVTATDAAGNRSSAYIGLTIADTTPPVIQSLTATPDVLSPPNGKLVPVTVSVSATDNCDAAPVSQLISITCSDPTAGPSDMQITGPLTAKLAAAKAPSGYARVYTLTIQSTDASGNSSTASVNVTVPHSNDPNHGKSPNATKKDAPRRR